MSNPKERSADFQSAVSQVSNLHGTPKPDAESNPAERPSGEAVLCGFDYVLIFRMFSDDLNIARDFARIGHFGAARQHLQSAMHKLDQLANLPESSQPKPESPSVDV